MGALATLIIFAAGVAFVAGFYKILGINKNNINQILGIDDE